MKKDKRNLKVNVKDNDKDFEKLNDNLYYISKVAVFDDFVYFNLRYSKFLELTYKLSNGTFLLIKRENKLLLTQVISQKDLSIYEDENKIKAMITHNEDITSTERDIYTSREYKLKILGAIYDNEFKKQLEFYPTRLDEVLFFKNFDIILNYFNKKVLNEKTNYFCFNLGKLKNGSQLTDYDLEVYLGGFILFLNLDIDFIIKFINSLSKNILIFTSNRGFALNLNKSNKFKLIDLASLNLSNLNKNEELFFKDFNVIFLYDFVFGFDSINIIKLLLEQFVKLDLEFILFLDDDINYFDDKFLAKNIFFKQFINRLNNKIFIYKTSSLDKFSNSLLPKVNYIISKDISLNDTNKIYSNFNLTNFYTNNGYEINNGDIILSFEK
ncbi:MAG: hypothetical protein ACP5RD_07095 [bacterium]|jgi:hypothetical protein